VVRSRRRDIDALRAVIEAVEDSFVDVGSPA
jgi:hypothetical protein